MSAHTLKLIGPVPVRLRPFVRDGHVTVCREGEPGGEPIAISVSEAEIMDPALDFYRERMGRFGCFIYAIRPVDPDKLTASTELSEAGVFRASLPPPLPPGFIVDLRNGTVVEEGRVLPFDKMDIGNHELAAKANVGVLR